MQNNEIYFLAGLPKAGTTAIAAWMTEALDLPVGLKEPGFFYNGSDLVSCYRGEKLSKRRVKFGDPPFCSGQIFDASPHYLHDHHFPYFEDCLLNLKAERRSVKVVVLLRDPVERAISHFAHHKRDGAEPLEINDALTPGVYEARRSLIPDLWTGYDYIGDSKFADNLCRLQQILTAEELFITSLSSLSKRGSGPDDLKRFLKIAPTKEVSFGHENASGSPRSVTGKIILKFIQVGSAVAASTVASPAITSWLKTLKRRTLSSLALEKREPLGLAKPVKEDLLLLFRSEYEFLKRNNFECQSAFHSNDA